MLILNLGSIALILGLSAIQLTRLYKKADVICYCEILPQRRALDGRRSGLAIVRGMIPVETREDEVRQRQYAC